MNQAAQHVIFRGQVQGVGFRYTVRQVAGQYEVTGFVRNLPDGTVEMFIQGDPTVVDNCIAEIQSEFAGYIRDTQIEPATFTPRYTDFRIVL